MADKELLDRIAAAVEDAETTPDEDLEWARHREPAKSPTAVYSIRIPADRIEELRQLAADRGVAPTALIRRGSSPNSMLRAVPMTTRSAGNVTCGPQRSSYATQVAR
ncbi:MAG: hypothetical protein LC799_04755 [Actinobacteria bacterium]|nr:hypothetical protein [Actinomycetota bacterium]